MPEDFLLVIGISMGNEGLKQQLLLVTVLHQLLVINSTLANIILSTENISGQLCLHIQHRILDDGQNFFRAPQMESK